MPVSSIPPKTQLPIRLLAIALSTVLLVYLVRKAGTNDLWGNIAALGWGFTWVIALAGVSHVAKTWAWRLTLGDDKRKISFPRMLGLRLGAEAAGQLGILGQTFGDSVRVGRMSPEIPIAKTLASVTLDRGLFAVTATITSIAGILAALLILSLSHSLRLYAGLFVIGMALCLLLAFLALRNRWHIFSRSAQNISRASFFKTRMEKSYLLIQSVEDTLFDFHHNRPGAFWASFFLNLASNALAVVEVALILWLMDAKIEFLSALVIEALTKVLNALGSCNPGNVGSYEGGNMLIAKMFGLSGATGIALAIARRARALFWAGLGMICLLLVNRQRKEGGCEMVGTTPGFETKEEDSPMISANRPMLESDLVVAILLVRQKADDDRFTAPLARVGSLPILLRAILTAQKLAPQRIMVIADGLQGMWVRRELFLTRRLPVTVEWFKIPANVSFAERLRFIIAKAGKTRLILLDGNTTFHPSLLRKAGEWNDAGEALALASGDEFAGIYASTVQTLRHLAQRCPAKVETLEELYSSPTTMECLVSRQVDKGLWQRVRTAEDSRLAEEKLDEWLVKPTDGIFARLNRRISIPMSRQLIKLPITANMVTIFTLGVGLVSGAFFALGGYWNTLFGAILCLWASILDGCDGEVARLKLLESDFGCWLETVCDYAFYLIFFAGMTIGQWRSSGTKAPLVCGGLLLFGAIASFLTTAWERQRLAAGHPEQLLKIWQGHAEKRAANPFMYLGRHLEFIIRRCFFPYAILVFALLNLMNVALILSVLGANLVWPIALYSAWAFVGGRKTTAASAPVSAWKAQTVA